MDKETEEKLAKVADSILRPFRFASKDAFSHITNIKDLERLVMTLADEALRLEPTGPVSSAFLELKTLFKGYDALQVSEMKQAVIRGTSILSGIKERYLKDVYSAYSILPAKTALFDKNKENTLKTSKEPPKTPAKPTKHPKKQHKNIKSPLLDVSGIGPSVAAKFKSKGISNVEELIYFLPIRYEDRRNIKKIQELTVGSSEVTEGEVIASGEARYGRRRVFEVAVSDGTGVLVAKWFNFRKQYMEKLYTTGKRMILYGQVGRFGAKKEIIHPDVEFTDGEGDGGEVTSAAVVPIYSQVEKLHQKTIRKILRRAVEEFAPSALSGIPDEVRKRLDVLPVADSLMELHKAGDRSTSSLDPKAKKSLVFDELFTLELGLTLKREHIYLEKGIRLAPGKSSGEIKEDLLTKRLLKTLPFELTSAQKRVVDEIKADMASAHPMNRLIQGDVGSGKTIVSIIAALTAVECGYQAAIMAPTEILAEQHFINIKAFTEGLNVKTTLLKGKMKAAEKRAALGEVASGEARIIVGTHAVIQKDVEFKCLGLAVIDEQHRFGVMQRAELKRKAAVAAAGAEGDSDTDAPPQPDMLIMTATPIPRTLTMTVFGDMDVSIIDELPPGRSPVETKILREKDRDRAYSALREDILAGGQAYIVYPLVEESEELPLRDATQMKEHLQEVIFPDFTLALLHGRMKGEEKEAVMGAFKRGETDILVSTTVIEVGVDVPNASLMLIEHAERFGLSQLHQLRGRVGRGERQSKCLLLAQWTNSDDALTRLRVMADTMDGFEIAEEDLKIRGPGDFLGSRQSGMPDFRIKETLSDLSILKLARDEARAYAKEADRNGGEWASVMAVLKDRWKGRLELAEIG